MKSSKTSNQRLNMYSVVTCANIANSHRSQRNTQWAKRWLKKLAPKEGR